MHPCCRQGLKELLGVEDMPMASLPESPGDNATSRNHVCSGITGLAHEKGSACLRSQLSCCSIRAASAEIWRSLHS